MIFDVYWTDGGTVRILHTADLHLQEKKKETLAALENILEVARSESAEVITLGGDIFHSPKDADILRPRLRKVFQESSSQIIAIPGNHDGQIFSKKFDFGFEVIDEEPFGIREFGDVAIVGVPYKEMPDDELLLGLRKAADGFSTRILLLHCTLDWGLNRELYGGESISRYFPISRDVLSEMGYSYILAGHFHSTYEAIDLNSGTFVYPGSPVSLSWKELGKRHVAIIDTSKPRIEQVPIESFYCDRLVLNVLPFHEKEVMEQIQNWYPERAKDATKLEVVINGVIAADEGEFQRDLEKAAPNAGITNEVRDVSEVLNHTLFKRFDEKLKESDDTKEKGTIRQIAMQVISSLIGSQELRP